MWKGHGSGGPKTRAVILLAPFRQNDVLSTLPTEALPPSQKPEPCETAMKSNAPKSIDPRTLALEASRLLVLIFEDGTGLTYADLEQAEWALHQIRRRIRDVKEGRTAAVDGSAS